jgi:hypothetical protein
MTRIIVADLTLPPWISSHKRHCSKPRSPWACNCVTIWACSSLNYLGDLPRMAVEVTVPVSHRCFR